MRNLSLVNLISIIFLRDFNIAKSYKIRFLFSIFYVFFQILIFYFLTAFITDQENSILSNKNLFVFFAIGICFLDISQLLISYASRQLEEFKVSGLYEEILSLPISGSIYHLCSNVYPLLFAFYRYCLYLFFINLFIEDLNLSINSFAMLFFIFIIFMISNIGLSLISISITIAFHKSAFFSSLFGVFAALFGGVFFSAQTLPDTIQFLSLILPIQTALDLSRGILNTDLINMSNFYEKIIILSGYAFFYIFIGLIILNLAIKYNKISSQTSNF
tara:strand:- start:149 stop:970 length:822 start_codon:yes stop_codon:yes gene_type:complete